MSKKKNIGNTRGTPLIVEVKKVLKSGLVVKMKNSRETGFIPKREFVWDQRIGAKIPTYEVGEILKVVPIEEEEETDRKLFSIKQTSNLWEERIGQYSVKDYVRGEVVNVRHFGAFVQIEPGIVGMIWPKDLPLSDDQIISEVLSIGDIIMAEIIRLDADAQQMDLSINRYLEYLDEHYDERVSLQLDIFKESFEKCKGAVKKEKDSETIQSPEQIRIYRKPIPFPEKILIVDDDPNEQKKIKKALKEACEKPDQRSDQKEKKKSKIKIHQANGSVEAVNLMKKEKAYDLAVVDFNLLNENGIEVAEKIWQLIPGLPILFMSSDPFVEESLREEFGDNFVFSDKTPNSIINWFDKLITGYEEVLESTENKDGIIKNSFIRNLEMETFANQDLSQKLDQLLKELVKKVKAKYAFVLEVDF